MTKRGPKSATEFIAELKSNPELVARREEWERQHRERQAVLQAAEEPLVKELAEVGCPVKSVWDLVNTNAPYPNAIPVLLKHLPWPYPVAIREGIARALAVPEAHQGWNELARAFESEPPLVGSTGWDMKWALALALGASATDGELDQVLRWVSDEKLGYDRSPLLKALARSRDPRSLEKLNELVKDPALKKDAEKALRRRMRKRK